MCVCVIECNDVTQWKKVKEAKRNEEKGIKIYIDRKRKEKKVNCVTETEMTAQEVLDCQAKRGREREIGMEEIVF